MSRFLVLFLCFALSACSAREDFAVVPEAMHIGVNRTVLMGTSRVPDPAGGYSFKRSPTLSFAEVTVSIPPERSTGEIPVAGNRAPNPSKHFLIADETVLASEAQFRRTLARRLAALPPDEREVSVFVHGFNNSYSDAAFRIAQMRYDLDVPGVGVAYAWPSRASALGYEYDDDSAIFARDGLEQLLRAVAASGANRVLLVAHSMGSFLSMETLRQIEIVQPGWSRRNLNGVILISPDISVDVFREQTSVFRGFPQPFVIFVSQQDPALRLSAILRLSPAPEEEDRLGTLSDVSLIADLPIRVLDVTAFGGDGVNPHFIAGSSPALLAILRRASNIDPDFLAGDQRVSGLLPGSTRVVQRAAGIRLVPPSGR